MSSNPAIISRGNINGSFQLRPGGTADTDLYRIADIDWIETNYYAYTTGVQTSNRCPSANQIFPIPNITTTTPTIINESTVADGGSVSNNVGIVSEIGICLSSTSTVPSQYDTILLQYSNINITAGYSWFNTLSYPFTPTILYYMRAYVLYNGAYYYGNNVVTVTTTAGSGYYDCGYGCQFYSYNPGCTPCTPGVSTTTTTTALTTTTTTTAFQSGTIITVQDIKESSPQTTTFNFVQTDNPNYINTGIVWQPTLTYKTFASFPSYTSIYSRFMSSSPYRSIWLGGVNTPSSSDPISISTNLFFNVVKTIHVLIIGDNEWTVNQNGTFLYGSSSSVDNNNFKYCHIVPVTTTIGNNNLLFTGKGDGNTQQTLGVVVLDNTKDELFDNPVSKSSWNVLWSSDSLVGITSSKICQSGSYNSTTDTCILITNISNWVLGDKVLITLVVPTNIQNTMSSWVLNYGDSTSSNGTTYQGTFQHLYSSGGSKTIQYIITMPGGITETISQIITL